MKGKLFMVGLTKDCTLRRTHYYTVQDSKLIYYLENRDSESFKLSHVWIIHVAVDIMYVIEPGAECWEACVLLI